MTTWSQISDEELAGRARRGSVGAFEELVRRYQVGLVNFLARRFGERGEAEDAVQEAMLHAYQHLDRYDPGQAFRPWLFAVTYRVGVTRARRRRRGRRMGELPVGAEAKGEGPSAKMEEREAGKLLWETAREMLSEEAFAALWLFYAEEMGAEEIGEILSATATAVRVMLHRARKKLMPHLAAIAPVC